MAINKRLFIYATFLLSCGAVALTVTSFATNEWLTGSMLQYDSAPQAHDDHIKYGLFAGVYDSYLVTTPRTFSLFITCLYAENVCVWSCNQNADDRVRELQQLYENGTGTSFQGCGGGSGSTKRNQRQYEKIVLKQNSPRELVKDQTFMNAILRMCTIVFLSIALIFALIGAVFAVINSAMNPIELMTGVVGLYYWNGVALACDVLVLGLWGGHFGVTLINNVAYTDVIMGYLISKDHVSLGYSYWCVLGAAALHICNVNLLLVRLFLIKKEPGTTTIQVIEENNDGALFLY